MAPDDGCLQRHMRKCQAPLVKYQEEIAFDLSKWNVKPSHVTMQAWNPMFRLIECLPLPPTRHEGEALEDYIDRAGPCPCEVKWEHFVCSNGRGERTFTGHAASGMYMTKAMETTPAGSYPMMVEYSEDGVPLNVHCQYRGVHVSKACACALWCIWLRFSFINFVFRFLFMFSLFFACFCRLVSGTSIPSVWGSLDTSQTLNLKRGPKNQSGMQEWTLLLISCTGCC